MNVRLKAVATSAALCCGIGLVSPAAFAASLSSADHDFLVSTAQGATYELNVAKLALQKSTRSDIKSYAHTMITDHKSLNPKLHHIAQHDGVDLPTSMTGEKQQSFDHLKSLDGKAFDTAFVNDEAEDNGTDVASEQKEIESTNNPQLKALVEQLKQSDTKHAKIGEALQQAGQ